MSTKTLYVLAALACALALTAGSAQANGGDGSTIVFGVQNVGDASAACPGAWFGLSFDMVSPDGGLLGTGRTCVESIVGCFPFVVGCEQTVRATFILDFAGGSLTVPMRLHELFVTDSSLTQRGMGRIAAGTGDFADARGRLKGGGTATFTEQGVVADLVYVVRLKGDVDAVQ